MRFFHCNIASGSWFNSKATALAYILLKLLQLSNVCGQLVLLDRLLRMEDMHYMTWIANWLSSGWYAGVPNRADINLFAVRVMCLIVTHSRPGHIGENEHHAMVCDLAINEWNRFFYVGYWVWSLLLLVVTSWDLGRQVWAMVPRTQVKLVMQLLSGNGHEQTSPYVVRKFVKEGLGWSKLPFKVTILVKPTILF